MTQRPTEHMTLQDGRNLTYGILGDPDGTPILFFHGTPGTHILAYMAEAGAKANGFKLIVPDRPGLGGSSPQEDRALYHYPMDILQLIEHLGIDQCGIVAVSGGSPYAMQCAHDLPQRIPYLASLSGWVSYGRPEIRHIPIDRLFKVIGGISRHTRPLLAGVGNISKWIVEKKPEKFLQHLRHKLPPSDCTILDDPFYRDIFLEDMKNAYYQGWEGAASEVVVQFSQPEFDMRTIIQPVYLLHGKADSIVPFAFCEYLNNVLPNVVEFVQIEDGGHLCAIPEQHNAFATIRSMHDSLKVETKKASAT